MKKLTALGLGFITAASLTLGYNKPANAYLAMLLECHMIHGSLYVGVYEFNGYTFQREFSRYCPPSVDV